MSQKHRVCRKMGLPLGCRRRGLRLEISIATQYIILLPLPVGLDYFPGPVNTIKSLLPSSRLTSLFLQLIHCPCLQGQQLILNYFKCKIESIMVICSFRIILSSYTIRMFGYLIQAPRATAQVVWMELLIFETITVK
jgi:hypothetical protein